MECMGCVGYVCMTTYIRVYVGVVLSFLPGANTFNIIQAGEVFVGNDSGYGHVYILRFQLLPCLYFFALLVLNIISFAEEKQNESAANKCPFGNVNDGLGRAGWMGLAMAQRTEPLCEL